MQNTLRPSNIPDPYRTAREFKMLIVKLEWLGFNDEAEELEAALSAIAPERFVCLVPEPTD